jgi:hypothetical protein
MLEAETEHMLGAGGDASMSMRSIDWERDREPMKALASAWRGCESSRSRPFAARPS